MCVGNPTLKLPRPITVSRQVKIRLKQQAPDWRSASSLRTGDKDIHVINAETGKTAVYHAHEAVISRGPRKSAYFENLSHCLDSFEHSENSRTISVRLDEKAARAFPVFLDYMYGNQCYRLTTENVLAVRKLADMFKNIPLLSETWRFIKSNMEANNYEYYLRGAQHFGDKQTASWVAYGCAQNIRSISPNSDIWRMMEQDDFRRLSSLIHLCRIGHSEHCSEIVAAYCMHHANELDERGFLEMTNSKVLPQISSKAAMILLRTEYRVRRASLEAKANENRMSSLQRRCMSILNAGKAAS